VYAGDRQREQQATKMCRMSELVAIRHDTCCTWRYCWKTRRARLPVAVGRNIVIRQTHGSRFSVQVKCDRWCRPLSTWNTVVTYSCFRWTYYYFKPVSYYKTTILTWTTYTFYIPFKVKCRQLHPTVVLQPITMIFTRWPVTVQQLQAVNRNLNY